MGNASRILLSLCLVLALPALVWAEDPATASHAPADSKTPDSKALDSRSDAREQKTLEGFGVQNPTCQEWSDGCAICTRVAAGAIACSLPGIACQPGTLACRRDEPAMPETPKTAEKPKPPEAPAK